MTGSKQKEQSKRKHKHNVFIIVGELFRQGVKMFFLGKSVKRKVKNKIPETSQKKKTGNKSGIFSLLGVIYKSRTN